LQQEQEICTKCLGKKIRLIEVKESKLNIYREITSVNNLLQLLTSQIGVLNSHIFVLSGERDELRKQNNKLKGTE